MRHAVDDGSPTALVVVVAEDLLPGMAGGAIFLKGGFFLGRAGNVPQQLGAAELRLNFGCGRKSVGFGYPIQDDVVELGGAVDRDRLSQVGSKEQRRGNAQRVGCRLSSSGNSNLPSALV